MLNNQLASLESELQHVKATNLELESELKQFRAAAEQSIEMMVFTDPEGIVFWCNKAVERTTGFTVQETIGYKAGLLWGKLMSKAWYAKLWHTIKTEKKIFIGEIENHRKNGEHFLSTITIYPLLDENNNIQFFIATQRDITLERAIDRMKTEFISLASHQLRTPLSSMKWSLEILLGGDLGKLNKKQRDATSSLDQSNERMIDLVNGLLNISRLESGRIIIEPVSTNLVKLVNDVSQELIEKFKQKKQKLTIAGNNNLPLVMLDPKLIRQVIINLLSNANKYTKKKGRVDVKISNKDQDMVVQVSDNGYGIPEEEKSRIFERFFRASNIQKVDANGTGLGLYLAKAIVLASGGKIWFESTVGIGSTFWFTVPISGIKPVKGDVRLS